MDNNNGEVVVVLLGLLGLIAGALIIGGIVYLAVKLTIHVIKTYRKRKHSKVVMADMNKVLKEMAKNPQAGRISMNDLDELEDDTLMAEYDEDRDEIVQYHLANDVDTKVNHLINKNDGMVIIED